MSSIVLTIKRDSDPMNPRKEYSNLGTMVCWHRRYNLGDLQPHESPAEWREANLPKDSVELPLYLFDHSGITMRADCESFRAADSMGWDWGRVGFIFCPPDKIKGEYSVTELTAEVVEKVRGVLLSEVKIYDQHLRGEVWGYIFKKAKPGCKECGHMEYDEDSCWGFIGETLEETGLQDCMSKEAKPLLVAAWNQRL